jgi:hypothetical protein
MIELSVIRDLVTIFGVIAGFSYYILTVQNTRKNQKQQLETRQAQLFMRLYETFSSREFRKQLDEVIFKIQYSDWEDMNQNYNREKNYDQLLSWFTVGSFFEGLGVLVKHNLINMAIVDDLLGTSIKITWEKMGPIEKESRKRFDAPRTFDDFEYLYNELIKYNEQHPELTKLSFNPPYPK